mgnify:CR=1 FL=1|jgi:hypothetical protein
MIYNVYPLVIGIWEKKSQSQNCHVSMITNMNIIYTFASE